MHISGYEPSSVILSQKNLFKSWKLQSESAKTSWSHKVWCYKPTKLQFQSVLIRKIMMPSKHYESTKVDRRTWLHLPSGTGPPAVILTWYLKYKTYYFQNRYVRDIYIYIFIIYCISRFYNEYNKYTQKHILSHAYWYSRSRSSGDLIMLYKYLGDCPRDLPAFPIKNPIFYPMFQTYFTPPRNYMNWHISLQPS